MNLPSTARAIPPMSQSAIAKVRKFEAWNLQREQTPITTHHLLHAGMYHRTITIPAGVALTGALIKRATTLIFNGRARVSTGDEWFDLDGYHVLAASAHRKQAFVACSDTQLTMIFPSSARTVEEAESEFTDEGDILFSRHGENVVEITGE
jgi:hypothetical protein